jgi:tripartite-type tricarboxylate transporter receptor subunit TctC
MLLRAIAGMMLSVAFAAPSPAQPYPSRPVEIVVPFAAGGGTDLLARMVAEGLSKRLGQSFVVLNRPGGNTNTGTLQVAKSPPDGTALVMASIGLAANPSLYRKLAFDPQADLAPISLLANSPTVLVVPPDFPASTVQEFIDYAKAHPGTLNYASYGAGSGPHLAAELFRSLTGVDIVHVPYSGGGPAVVGVMAGQVQMLFSSVLPVLGAIRGGKLKAIAIASDERTPLLPGVPTFADSGLDYRTGTWFGLLAPARTPETVIAALNREAVATLHELSVRERIVEQGAEVVASSPEEFRDFLKAETDRLAAVVRNAKMQLD